MRNLSVVNVNVKGMVGYQIQGIHRACSDSMWETVAHAAIFRDKARAERFLKRVKTSLHDINWKYWGVPQGAYVSAADAYKDHVAPFSVL
jgi:hypothetical protein